MDHDSRDFWHIDRGGWIALIGGLACAFLPFFWVKFHWIMSYLKILIHELGHSLIAWSFGYPGVPTFNLQHGGGVARHGPQAPWLLVVLGIVFCLFIINNYKNVRVMILSGAGFLVYLLCIFTPLHKMLELYMGHGLEIVIAGVFLFRAASNWAVYHAAERCLYGFAGFYLIFENIIFSFQLLFDKGYRAVYFEGIAPGLLNDFFRIWVEHLKTASFDLLVVFHFLITILGVIIPIALHILIRWQNQHDV